MRTRSIARIALSALCLTGIHIVRADDSEGGGPWKTNYKMGTKAVQTGTTTTTTWITIDPLSGGSIPVTTTTPVYTTYSCCVPATDSDACNSGAANSHC